MAPNPPTTHTRFEELLYLEPDGMLSPAERSQLDRHLATCSSCRAERRAVAHLAPLLESSRVPVESDFTDRVLANLPEAGWETRSRSGLVLAAVAFLVLSTLAALAGLGSGTSDSGPLAGTYAALVDLFASALVTGAGLLVASWRGLGLALGDVLRGSPLAMAVFGVLVLGVDVLFVRLLLRRRAASSRATGRRGAGS